MSVACPGTRNATSSAAPKTRLNTDDRMTIPYAAVAPTASITRIDSAVTYTVFAKLCTSGTSSTTLR
jgi:hypothetical protein